MNKPVWTPVKIALVLLPTALLTLLVISLAERSYAERLFVHSTYYLMMVTVLCWAGTYLFSVREARWATVVAWVKENWPGLVIAFVVTLIAALAIHPALRMLSDESNLVGISKNLFSSRTATFTTSGKYYYDSFWDVDVVIDPRPTLFPFLVSLVHVLCGYSYRNAFLFNLMVLPAFVLVAYRLAKSLGGEIFAVVASLLVVAHPMTLISARSGGFDFFSAFFALLVLKSLFDHSREPSPVRLAILWMNLCLFTEIRYENGLFIPPVVALLFLLRMVTWTNLRPYVFIYALTPAYLLPRIWQGLLVGNVPHQDPGVIVFSFKNFLDNSRDYFSPILSPFASNPAHSAVVIALGVVGCVFCLPGLYRRLRSRDWKAPNLQFATLVIVWMLVQVIIVFTYVWGRAQYPASARLVLAIDTFFAFPAAWALTFLLRRWRPLVAVLLAAAVLAFYLPVASQHRMFNRLTQTREAATTWRFFESLHEKRILIVTDRPSHYTIMEYGAMDFETARQDPVIFEALARHLFYDIYVVQSIALTTKKPLPGYDIWPTRSMQTMLEFQNDANVLVRISRLDH
jgi:4-amino-4-deoxy-L-arabinose transferase-like glycosyltransferase